MSVPRHTHGAHQDTRVSSHVHTLSVIDRSWAEMAHVTGDTECTYVLVRQHWCKIGKTTYRQFDTRMRRLRSPIPGVLCPPDMDLAAPLILVRLIPHNVERMLHERWDCWRVPGCGEWFDAEAVLSDLAGLDFVAAGVSA